MRAWLLGALVALAVVCAGSSALARQSPATLLAAYQPVTVFDPSEHFRPSSVETFIVDSDLEALAGSATFAVQDPAPTTGTLPTASTMIWRLNQRTCSPNAPVGGLACYAEAFAAHGASGVVYGRVVRVGEKTVLQYWYFYYEDLLSYRDPPSDFIWQSHEGDWEVVTVVLDHGRRPVEVGYSQHCRGQRRLWGSTPRLGIHHPVVHVALGSHANYFTAGTHPIAAACLPARAVALFRQAGLPLPADFVTAGPVGGPASAHGQITRIKRVSRAAPRWLAFPGLWGELQYLHAPGVGTFSFGASPNGPAFHPLWRDPLKVLARWPLDRGAR